jgi:cytochrome d ubiquinol oxidase subunit II
MIAKGAMGMRLEGVVDAGGPSNPLMSASVGAGRLAGQLRPHPWMLIAPLAGLVGPLVAMAGIACGGAGST